MSLETFLPVAVIVAIVMGVALAAMAIGVMFKRPCLRGSCGGPASRDGERRSLSCEGCPNRR